jgi:regulator of replication initiation timing
MTDIVERLREEVDQLRAISRKLYVEKAHLLADKISNEIMRENYDKLVLENAKLRSDNSKMHQKLAKGKPKPPPKDQAKSSSKKSSSSSSSSSSFSSSSSDIVDESMTS